MTKRLQIGFEGRMTVAGLVSFETRLTPIDVALPAAMEQYAPFVAFLDGKPAGFGVKWVRFAGTTFAQVVDR